MTREACQSPKHEVLANRFLKPMFGSGGDESETDQSRCLIVNTKLGSINITLPSQREHTESFI